MDVVSLEAASVTGIAKLNPGKEGCQDIRSLPLENANEYFPACPWEAIVSRTKSVPKVIL